MTGLTLRQIDQWINKGLLGDHLRNLGSGAYRRFTGEDIAVLRAVGAFGQVIGGWSGNFDPFAHRIEEAIRRDGAEGWLIVTHETAVVTLDYLAIAEHVGGFGGVVVQLPQDGPEVITDWPTHG